MATIITKAVIDQTITPVVPQTEKKKPKNVDDILYVKMYDSSKPADLVIAKLQSEGSPQIVKDLMGMAINVLKNNHLKAPQKVEKLTMLSKQLRSGWPFKNTQRFNRFSSLLSEKVLAMANTILSIEKVRSGKKDTGEST